MLRIVPIAVVGLLLGAGCGLHHPPRDRDGSRALLESPDAARRLQVVRVAPATGAGGSGFPISPRLVVTAAHVCDEALVLNVDGLPMAAVGRNERLHGPCLRWFKRGEGPLVDDWILLAGSLKRFTPNLVDFDFRPTLGQEVLLGGFFLGKASAAQRRHLQPEFVRGWVTEDSAWPPKEEGAVRVKVPADDYGGFSGGPAAYLGADSKVRVWGVVVYGATYWKRQEPVYHVLTIAPLPRELQELTRAPARVVPQVMVPLPQPAVEQTLQVLPATTEHGQAAAIPIDARTVIMAGASLRGGVLAAVINGRPWVAVGDPERLARVLDEAKPVPYADDWVLLSLKESRYPPPDIVDPGAKPNAFALALAWSGSTLANVIDSSAMPPPGGKVVVGGFRPLDPAAAANQPKAELVEGRTAPARARSHRAQGAVLVWVPPGDYSGFVGGPAATLDPDGRFRVWGIIVGWDQAEPQNGRAEARLVVAPLAAGQLEREPRDIPRVLHTLLPTRAE
jgi:hypothetical protein